MESCGTELAEGAVVPELIAELLEHVSNNMVAHAEWVGTDTPDCAAENLALLRVAELYRSSAAAARCAADAMRSMQHLRPAPHDPSQWDSLAFSTWMTRKLELQTQLANLLLGHASQSRAVLDSL